MHQHNKTVTITAIAGMFLLGTAVARAENITLPASAAAPVLTGYIGHPKAAGSAPAILVLHGCGGFGDREKTTVDDLAAHGYVALAIDTLKPQGLSNGCGNPESSRVGSEYAAAALTWLSTQPFVAADKLGIMGYSEGAIETLDIVDPRSTPLAVPAGLRVAVAYYPACGRRIASALTVPLRILDGDADDWTPAPPCQTLAAAAPAAGKTVLITTYPNDHVRIVRGHTLRYDPVAAADAEAKTIAFFAQYLR
jgi:dienelactone hydrolase